MLDESVRKGGDLRSAAARSRDVRYAGPDAPLHPLTEPTDDPFVDKLRQLDSAEPGSAEFMQAHLVGSMAPEEVIEVQGPVGPEGFGTIKRLDGKTGKEI